MTNSTKNSPDLLLDLLNLGTEYLERNEIESPRLNAEWLLADILNLSRVDLYVNHDRPVTLPEKDKYRDYLRRRANHVPLQLIVGHTEFYGHRISVSQGVLIPRPETELIIDIAKELIPEKSFKNVLDIGCGTGAISVLLVKEKIAEKVTAVDISRDAVQLTKINALNSNLSKKQLLAIDEDVFASGYSPQGKPFDLIVSNPPYIKEDDWDSLAPEIRNFEPKAALLSGDDGLDAHWAIAKSISNWLTPDGMFIGEIGMEQGEEAKTIHESWSQNVSIRKDHAGLDRFVIAGPPKPRCGVD